MTFLSGRRGLDDPKIIRPSALNRKSSIGHLGFRAIGVEVCSGLRSRSRCSSFPMIRRVGVQTFLAAGSCHVSMKHFVENNSWPRGVVDHRWAEPQWETFQAVGAPYPAQGCAQTGERSFKLSRPSWEGGSIISRYRILRKNEDNSVFDRYHLLERACL